MFLGSNINRALRGRGGAVSALAAIVLPLSLGTAGLVIEHGRGLVHKVENQRVADLSAYAGAVAYAATTSQTAMVDAARAVARMNGAPTSAVAVALVASPTGTAATSAVRVTVTTSVQMILSRLLGAAPSMPVPAEAFAELRPTADSCILALAASGSGVALTGGTQVTAPGCAVASNAAISVPCGTTMRAMAVAYNSAAAPSAPCGGITGVGGATATIVKKTTPDPLAANADIATARARLASVAALAAPASPVAPPAPTVAVSSGPFLNIEFGSNELTTTVQALALGCTASKSGSVWTLSCAPGTHKLSAFTIGRGLLVNVVGDSTSHIIFALAVNTGPAINFGNSNYSFLQGLTIGYGGATFGTGTLEVAGNLNTGGSGGTANFASRNITVTGNVSLSAITNFTGTGLFWIGGSLTTSGTPSVAHSEIRAVGNFAVTSPARFGSLSTLSVGGAMTVGTSGAMSFGGGTWNIVGGLTTSGSSTITIGAGSFTIGRSLATCNGSQFSICSNAHSLIFAGPSSFALRSGVTVGGGSILVLGDGGTTNSFRIGAATNGNAVQIAGGSIFRMGDATGTTSVFELGGHFNVASGGGSCTVIGAASQHDINGSVLTAGATILGPGVYTVSGSVGLGANGGGNVMCNGSSVGLLANGVSLVIGAAGDGLTSTCANQAFCVAAGYQSVVLTAPGAGPYRRFAVVGPATGGQGAYFTQGASGTTISGLFYMPVGAVRLDGSATVGSGSGECLQLIGKEVALSGGSLLASTCISGSTSGSRVVLVR